MTPDDKAKQVARKIWETDNASQWFGMELVDATEGAATMTMVVQANHLNGHGTCHGGVTFALADSTFGFACNSRNQATVAMHNSITYTAPGKVGDVLTATAQEVSMQGRNGIYDVRVTNHDDVLIAEFRGMSRAVRGQIIED